MRKVLMVATVASMIGQFNMDNIRILQQMGYLVDVACDFTDCSVWSEERVKEFQKQLDGLGIAWIQIDFTRNLWKLNQHRKAYKQLKKLIIREEYSFIHCHTPIASVISRIIAHRENVKVIYTAHGFHFYKGAPLKNWLLFYPVERFLAKWTDVLITINREDYEIADKCFKAKTIEYIPGVGVDIEKGKNHIDKASKRAELGLTNNDVVLLSIGELSTGKNHIAVLNALAQISDDKVKYIICGQGLLERYLHIEAEKLGLQKQVIFLGFRRDVLEICEMADIFIFPSLREGLPVALMEAMLKKMPCIVSKIRGNIDLIEEGKGGFLVEKNDFMTFAEKINLLKNDLELRRKMGEENFCTIQNFSDKRVEKYIEAIYERM